MMEFQHILKSREVSMREKEAAKLKHQQHREMEQKWVDKHRYDTVSIDMADALSKVRTSDVSIPVQLSRYNGSYLHAQMSVSKKR